MCSLGGGPQALKTPDLYNIRQVMTHSHPQLVTQRHLVTHPSCPVQIHKVSLIRRWLTRFAQPGARGDVWAQK